MHRQHAIIALGVCHDASAEQGMQTQKKERHSQYLQNICGHELMGLENNGSGIDLASG